MKKIKTETERLVIRQFCSKDAEGYFKLVYNPKVNCFVSEKLDTLEQAKEKVEKMSLINDGSQLAVCLKETDEFVGTLFGVWEEDIFSICWNFLDEYCSKGYAFESAKAYVNFLFNELNARRIYAYVEDYNLSSQKLCKKLGMRQEGLFKEFISFVNNPDGTPRYENTMQFAILKKEWNGAN